MENVEQTDNQSEEADDLFDAACEVQLRGGVNHNRERNQKLQEKNSKNSKKSRVKMVFCTANVETQRVRHTPDHCESGFSRFTTSFRFHNMMVKKSPIWMTWRFSAPIAIGRSTPFPMISCQASMNFASSCNRRPSDPLVHAVNGNAGKRLCRADGQRRLHMADIGRRG